MASYMAPDSASLKKALAAVSIADKYLLKPRTCCRQRVQDPSLASLLNQRAGLTALLVLPCCAQTEYLQLLADHTKQLPVVGAVLTGLEEATSLGAVIGTLASSELPIAGVADA